MTSTERLRTAGFPKQGSAIWGDNGSFGANTWKGMGLRMLPGIGGVASLGDAAKSFGQGKFWGGVGNLGMAALGFLPGGGLLGAAGRGLKGVGGILGAGAKMLPGANTVMRGATAVAGKMPTVRAVGSAVGNKTMDAIKGVGSSIGTSRVFKPYRALQNSAPMKYMAKHPWQTTGGALAFGAGTNYLQDRNDEAESVYSQTADSMKGMLSKIHQSPVFSNPMFSDPNNKPPGYDLANRFLN